MEPARLPAAARGQPADDRVVCLAFSWFAVACRVARSCRELGIKSVAPYTDADALSLHVKEVDVAVPLGAESKAYTDADLLVKVMKEQGCSAVHAGYGFLSENSDFVSGFWK